ncbi:MAG: AMIN domain-containing protein [Nevskiaceae bacterium]|nr:MAG: AMIN domain-containing protein [Nevskiaceae bacterium]
MRGIVALLLTCVSFCAMAGQLSDIQFLDEGQGVRVTFELDAAPHASVFTLTNPDRLVVDLSGARASAAVRSINHASGIVRNVRFGRHGDALRVVFDLNQHVQVQRSSPSGHQLVVKMTPVGGRVMPSPAVVRSQPNAAPKPVAVLRAKPIVVAVDAGHGGRDPGAHGPSGLEEKTVTLAIARKLARLIDAQPGMRAVLTRKGDNYVGLRERMVVARKADADIFISIHCNAVRDPSVRGTAVYMLSQHGATSEQARWVADRENASDMVGGIDISDKSSQLASVLVDISQSATLDASFDLAARLLQQMGHVVPRQHAAVQRAGFMVLKAPDIPSVLVETAFITNRKEEQMLRSSRYQSQIADQLLAGVRGYFAHYRPKQRVPIQTANAAHGALQTAYEQR